MFSNLRWSYKNLFDGVLGIVFLHGVTTATTGNGQFLWIFNAYEDDVIYEVITKIF